MIIDHPHNRLSIALSHFSADQFARLRDGDRFFFTHNNEAGSLSEAGRQYIMERKFSDIICDNTNLVQIQPNAFKVPNDSDNVLSNCIESQDTDLIQLIQNNNFRGRSTPKKLRSLIRIHFLFLHSVIIRFP